MVLTLDDYDRRYPPRQLPPDAEVGRMYEQSERLPLYSAMAGHLLQTTLHQHTLVFCLVLSLILAQLETSEAILRGSASPR